MGERPPKGKRAEPVVEEQGTTSRSGGRRRRDAGAPRLRRGMGKVKKRLRVEKGLFPWESALLAFREPIERG